MFGFVFQHGTALFVKLISSLYLDYLFSSLQWSKSSRYHALTLHSKFLLRILKAWTHSHKWYNVDEEIPEKKIKAGFFEATNLARFYWYCFSYFFCCSYGFDYFRIGWDLASLSRADPFGSLQQKHGHGKWYKFSRNGQKKGSKHIFLVILIS